MNNHRYLKLNWNIYIIVLYTLYNFLNNMLILLYTIINMLTLFKILTNFTWSKTLKIVHKMSYKFIIK